MKIYFISIMSLRMAFVLSSCFLFLNSCSEATKEGSTSDSELEPDTSITTSTAYSEFNHCDDSNRYANEIEGGGSFDFNQVEYENAVITYREEAQGLNERSGFFISKRAIDQLFDMDPEANGIYIDLFHDEAGSLNILVSSTKSSKTIISGPNTGEQFVVQSFCPDDCSSVE